MPKKIVFATMKGGTGKTTLSYTIGCFLARDNKVLMIDCDPQCNISVTLGMDIYNEKLPSIADIFETFDIEPDDIYTPSPLDELPNLDLIPSTLFLSVSETALATKAMREMFLTNYIERYKDWFDYYDYIIFDTNPGMGIVNQNAFFACDHIILSADPSACSALGGDIFMRLWKDILIFDKNQPLKIDAFILNNMEYTNASRDIIKYVREHAYFKDIVLTQQVPHLTAFKESISEQKPLFLMAKKNSTAIRAIESVIEELKERGVL